MGLTAEDVRTKIKKALGELKNLDKGLQCEAENAKAYAVLEAKVDATADVHSLFQMYQELRECLAEESKKPEEAKFRFTLPDGSISEALNLAEARKQIREWNNTHKRGRTHGKAKRTQ